MLRFACPGCKKVLSAPEERAGVVVSCPQCKKPLKVPAAAQAPAPAAPPVVLEQGGGLSSPAAVGPVENPLPVVSADEWTDAIREEDEALPVLETGTGPAGGDDLRLLLPAGAPPEAFQLGPLLHATKKSEGLMGRLSMRVVAAVSAGMLVGSYLVMIIFEIPLILPAIVGLAGCVYSGWTYYKGSWHWNAEAEAKPRQHVSDRRILCRDGLVSVDDNVVTVARWEEVDRLHVEVMVTHTTYKGITVRTVRHEYYTVRLMNGRVIDINGDFLHHEPAREILERKTTPHILARAKQVLRAGEIIDLEGVYVRPDGVGGRGGFAPWAEINRVVVQEDELLVLGADIAGEPLVSQSTNNVVNCAALIALIADVRAQGFN